VYHREVTVIPSDCQLQVVSGPDLEHQDCYTRSSRSSKDLECRLARLARQVEIGFKIQKHSFRPLVMATNNDNDESRL